MENAIFLLFFYPKRNIVWNTLLNIIKFRGLSFFSQQAFPFIQPFWSNCWYTWLHTVCISYLPLRECFKTKKNWHAPPTFFLTQELLLGSKMIKNGCSLNMVSCGSSFARVGPGSLNDQKWAFIKYSCIGKPMERRFQKVIKRKKNLPAPTHFLP